MVEAIYILGGKKYRKLERDEVIEKGAMHSICGGELRPIMGLDTIGDIPSSFSIERDFYNPIPDTEGFCQKCKSLDPIYCERTDMETIPFTCSGCGRLIVIKMES